MSASRKSLSFCSLKRSMSSQAVRTNSLEDEAAAQGRNKVSKQQGGGLLPYSLHVLMPAFHFNTQ